MSQTDAIGTIRPAETLAEHQLVLDSQDIEAELTTVPAARRPAADEITGVLARIVDPDTVEIWATGSSRPFDRQADYVRLA